MMLTSWLVNAGIRQAFDGMRCRIQLAETVRDLGVLLDVELTLKVAHYEGCRRRCVGQDVAVHIVLALIISRQNFLYSSNAGLSCSTVRSNCAAKITPARTECCSSTGLPTRSFGLHLTGSHAVALACC